VPATIALTVVVAVLVLVLTPSTAWAWTPGTHVFLGEAVMRSVRLLPSSVADLLHAFPYDFLYGSIAADTSMAKKYAPVGRHCHSWHVGLEIYERADDGPLRAFGLGYLAHLAADVVAHNYFVPRQLALTSSTTALGHSYWESRIEGHLGDRHAHRAAELLLLDHSRSDGHLDRILSPTIFSMQTNRRIFRGMVYVTDMGSWQRIVQLVAENSRWDLPDQDVGAYMARSYDFIMDFLQRLDHSEPFKLDPAGETQLHLAKRVRRGALLRGGADLVDEASRHFGLPPTTLSYARELDTPLYPAVSSSS
jgi:hypothetical protein